MNLPQAFILTQFKSSKSESFPFGWKVLFHSCFNYQSRWRYLWGAWCTWSTGNLIFEHNSSHVQLCNSAELKILNLEKRDSLMDPEIKSAMTSYIAIWQDSALILFADRNRGYLFWSCCNGYLLRQLCPSSSTLDLFWNKTALRLWCRVFKGTLQRWCDPQSYGSPQCKLAAHLNTCITQISPSWWSKYFSVNRIHADAELAPGSAGWPRSESCLRHNCQQLSYYSPCSKSAQVWSAAARAVVVWSRSHWGSYLL